MRHEEFNKKYEYFTEVGFWRERNNLCLEYIKTLEHWYSELEYKFECVLDIATGGKASKSNIDLEIAYKLISDNIDFWVNSATKELEEEINT